MEYTGRMRGFLERHASGIDVTAALALSLFIALSLFYSLRYHQVAEQLEMVRGAAPAVDVKREAFVRLFVHDVLFAEKAIDFETRLTLETTVRQLNDPKILAMWQAFTDSKTEKEAQQAVKKLLEALVAAG